MLVQNFQTGLSRTNIQSFAFVFTFTFMHLSDAFIQSDLQYIPVIHFCQYMCFLGIEPTIFALLTQCSNHWATGTHFKLWIQNSNSALYCHHNSHFRIWNSRRHSEWCTTTASCCFWQQLLLWLFLTSRRCIYSTHANTKTLLGFTVPSSQL